jgi:hypothetical protein
VPLGCLIRIELHDTLCIYSLREDPPDLHAKPLTGYISATRIPRSHNLVKKDIPALVVSMWWEEQNGQECRDFLKGIGSTNERCAILTRGDFQRAVGTVLADKQIMRTLPHPTGGRWNDITE